MKKPAAKAKTEKKALRSRSASSSEGEEEKQPELVQEEEEKVDTKSKKKVENDFEEKLDDAILKLFAKRFEGNSPALNMVCGLANIELDKDSLQLQRDLYEFCKEKLKAFKKDTKGHFILTFQSPYEIIAKEVINSCNFLLRLNSSFKKTESTLESEDPKNETNSISDLGDEDIKPLPMNRSFSTAQESQIDSKSKKGLENLRDLVNTYQKWKEWHQKDVKESEEYFYQDNASPLKSVLTLIMKKIPLKDLELCLKNHLVRASQRVIGVQMIQNIFELLINTPFDRYFFGLITQNFSEDHLTNVTAAPHEFKNLIESFIFNILDQLVISFNNKMNTLKGFKLKHINNILNKSKGDNVGFQKWRSIMQQSLSGIACNLRDIIALAANKKIIRKLLTQEDSKLQGSFGTFLENLILLSQISHSFTYLSLSCDQLAAVGTTCIHNVKSFIHLVQKSGHQTTVNQIFEIILRLLKKEIGLTRDDATLKYKINARILQCTNDPVVIERIEFLMEVTASLINRSQIERFNSAHLNELGFFCMTLAFHHNAPKMIKAITRLIEVIVPVLDFSTMPTPYDIEYYYYQYTDYENMIKAGKTQATYKFNSDALTLKKIEVPAAVSKAGEIKMNNCLGLLEKLGDKVLMRSESSINLKNLIDHALLKNEIPKEKKYGVYVHLANEEDLMFFIRILYFWEDKYPSFTKVYPKTIEEYTKYKENLNKKDSEPKKIPGTEKAQTIQQQTAEWYFKNTEKIFANFPDFNILSKNEDDLPFGWEYNVLGNFTDGRLTKFDWKRSKSRKNVRKVWVNANLGKIEKKMEEVSKIIEEFKETDTEEDKLQIVQAKVFVWRMQQHIKDAMYLATFLNIYGFCCIGESLSIDKALELADLINLGIKKKLKNIPIEHFKEELRKKVDPTNLNPLPVPVPVEPKEQQPPKEENLKPIKNPPPQNTAPKLDPNQKSEMRVSLIEHQFQAIFESNSDYICTLNTPKETFYPDANKIPVFHNSVVTGNSTNILIDDLVNFIRNLLSNSRISDAALPGIQKIIDAFGNNPIDQTTLFDRSVFAGFSSVIGGWCSSIKPGYNVLYDEISTRRVTMVYGGPDSGKKTAHLILNNDSNMIAQPVDSSNLRHKLKSELPEKIKIEPSTVIKCVKFLVQSHEKMILEKDVNYHIEYSLLMRALLKVCQAIEWSKLLTDASLSKDDINNFVNFVMKLSSNCPADKGHEYYEAKFAEAWEALIDKKNPVNHQFFYPAVFNTLGPYSTEDTGLGLAKLERKESQGPVIAEGLLPNSIYISTLPEYQPLVSEYKMLKYWEKNIIPKIQDFVRSSYKPFEFEEFFEQLRQPLRKGDHTKAAEIAYILCDQRLPAGCTLPEPNHDWSTISIEEIVLGTWAVAIIGGKKNRLASPFFQNQSRFGNKEALVQIVSTDAKSNSVLVFYHDPQILQTLSVWLPVTAVKFPELPLQLPAASYPYDTIIENYKDASSKNLAFLARGTIFKFFTFGANEVNILKKESELMKSYSVNLINLLKWAALDELTEDPVEGWLGVNEWEIDLERGKSKKSTTSATELVLEAAESTNKTVQKAFKLNTLKNLLQYVAESKDHAELDQILAWSAETLMKTVNFMNQNASAVDLQKPYVDAPVYVQGGPRPIFSLNRCLPDIDDSDELTVSSITVSFKKESSLCMNSGIKFFDDPDGINQIQHVPAGGE